MTIAERLKEARKKAGMTQDQVAEKIMVSRVTVSHWENGRSLPDIVSLIDLSDLYCVSLDELVKGDSKMTEKVKKDAKDSRNNKRLIQTTAVLVTAVLLAYLISIVVGGSFKDFCQAAIAWVLMGIGVASWLAYAAQKEKNAEKDPTDPSDPA
jgi:transcriptional regulator with XRE-family HTH domain